MVNGIYEANGDTCIGGFKRISENGVVGFVERYDKAVFEGKNVYNNLFARMLGSAPNKHDAIRMSVWNVMYSMDIVRTHNIEFPSERVFISEDIIWDSEYYKYAKRAIVIDSTAYNYRITPGSLTQKYKPDMMKKICVLYNEMCNRLPSDKEKIVRLQRQFFVNLRACIKQERHSVSGKSNVETKAAIKKIVNDGVVHTIAKEYLQFVSQRKQKMFVWAVRYKCVTLLYLLNKAGML